MLELTPDACRVLGTLIEKAQTVPAQYPLTLNSIVSGTNQKNNRDPVVELDEERVLGALDSLRGLGLVHEVILSGSRVPKYRHLSREVLGVNTSELVILAELLLRGPQTVGELRGRASRMHPLESLETVGNFLESLRGRERPLVEELPPIPGTRANRWRQLLCRELHPIDVPHHAPAPSPGAAPPPPASPIAAQTNDRLEELERRLGELASRVEAIERAGGPL
ncbi:MAG: YceH family protein [Phycisphaerales bacterium]